MESSSTASIPTLGAFSFVNLFHYRTNVPEIYIKLASTNYMLWKAHVVPILRGYRLLGYVTKEIPSPPTIILGDDGVSHPNPTPAH